MVWTVEASDGTEERRGRGRGGEDDRQPESLPFWLLARCGDDIDQKRTGWPPFPSVMVQRSEG